MRSHFATLLLVISMALTACSMQQDITPPPGYQPPAPVTPTSLPTASPQLTMTQTEALHTPQPTPTTNPAETATEGTQVSGSTLGNFNGMLVNGSGSSLPGSQKVTLVGFDKDQSGTYQKVLELEQPVNPDGTYVFSNVEAPINRTFLIITSWGGVEYQSDPVVVTASAKNFSIPLTIYEKTEDLNALSFSQVHLIFDLASARVVQVTELLIMTNLGKQAVVVSSDGKTIPFIHLPTDAINIQFQLSQGSAQLLNATNGFAIMPGADKQYGFVASFELPYAKSLLFDQPFSLPVPSLTIFVPQGMKMRGQELADAGVQAVQGQSYQMYQVNNLASGSSLTMTLSGSPGAPNGFVLDRQTSLMIGIGLVGLLLIAVGIWLYMRDRARLQLELMDDSGQTATDALGEDRDNIVDAMIALDDQYTSGGITKEAYEQRRSDLKDRLKSLL